MPQTPGWSRDIPTFESNDPANFGANFATDLEPSYGQPAPGEYQVACIEDANGNGVQDDDCVGPSATAVLTITDDGGFFRPIDFATLQSCPGEEVYPDEETVLGPADSREAINQEILAAVNAPDGTAVRVDAGYVEASSQAVTLFDSAGAVVGSGYTSVEDGKYVGGVNGTCA